MSQWYDIFIIIIKNLTINIIFKYLKNKFKLTIFFKYKAELQ